MDRELEKRSNGNCELCNLSEELVILPVSPKNSSLIENCIHICTNCNAQITGETDYVANHWRCLNDSIWSEVDAVKVVAWRVLNELKSEGWTSDLMDMMYLDEATEAWAKEGLPDEDAIKHVDSNGVQLQSGDSVVLIKDLKVKGGNFTAKRGTHVRNIVLVHDNANHIEGKVEDQRVVILTQYVKK
ncbi:PhnA domain-containing protein [Crocinitomicaceae bacterium]|nr:PhnA domain-containing protein [Crocinitomicaceae bacterium]